MAVKTKAQLKTFADANITSNGVNSNDGGDHNTMLTDLIDSMLNTSDDTLSIVTNVYRSASAAITTSVTQITFSTALPSNLYEISITDASGVGFEKITDKQATGFKITGLTNGTIIYFVILTN